MFLIEKSSTIETKLNMKTLVVGASPNPSRYSNKAVRLLRKYNHEVIPLGIRNGEIDNLKIIRGKPEISGIHTITLYIGQKKQVKHYDYLLGLHPKRIIFNPGTENTELTELTELAQKQDINIVQNCTLVMLNTDKF